MARDLSSFVDDCVERLGTSEEESAFHALVEASKDALPLIIRAYERPALRGELSRDNERTSDNEKRTWVAEAIDQLQAGSAYDGNLRDD